MIFRCLLFAAALGLSAGWGEASEPPPLDGRIDPSFQPVFRGPTQPDAALGLPDGSWLVSGRYDSVSGAMLGPLHKVRADGTVDPTFSTAGQPKVGRVLRQPDGRLLCFRASPDGVSMLAVSRLLANGSPDPSFQNFTANIYSDGLSQLGFDDASTAPFSVDPLGRLYFYQREGSDLQHSPPYRLVRRLIDGRPDESFVTPLTSLPLMRVSKFRVLTNGAVYVREAVTPRGRLVRLAENGSPAFTADFDYPTTPEPVLDLLPLAATAGGKLYVGLIGDSDITVIRLSAEGARDTSFGPLRIPGRSVHKPLVAAQALGESGVRVLTGGTDFFTYDYSVSTLNAPPSPQDGTFSAQGRVLGLSPDGAVLIGRFTALLGGSNLSAELKLLRAGENESTVFGPAQAYEMPVAPSLTEVVAARDGRWFARAGNVSSVDALFSPQRLMFRASGELDPNPGQALANRLGTTFGTLQFDGFLLGGPSVAFGATGALYLTAAHLSPRTNSTSLILRLKPDGAIDESWSARSSGDWNGVFRHPVEDEQGRVLVFHSPLNPPDAKLLRLLPDGQTDAGFVSGLPYVPPVFTFFPVVPIRLLTDPAGGILALYFPSDSTAKGLLRLHPDGSRDPTFDAGPLNFSVQNPLGSGLVLDLVKAADGGIYVLYGPPEQPATPSGPAPTPQAQVIKLLPGGGPAPGFPVNLDLSRYSASKLFVQPDGRFVVTGDFRDAGGRERVRAARFDAQGRLDGSFRAASQPTIQLAGGDFIAAAQGSVARLHNESLPFRAASGRGQLINLSTRARVGSGDRILIAGFVLAHGPSRVLLRGLGPSLQAFDIAEPLADPVLELYDATGTRVARNDDWRVAQRKEIEASGLAPAHDREAALLLTLPAGAYTLQLRASGSEGVGLVEAYLLEGPDLDSPPPAANAPRAINLSTRGYVGPEQDQLIGGFAVRGGKVRAVVRAVGSSLTVAGVSGALRETDMQAIRLSDQRTWFSRFTIQNDREQYGPDYPSTAPLQFVLRNGELQTVAEFPEGNYTVRISAFDGISGIGMFEIYELPEVP